MRKDYKFSGLSALILFVTCGVINAGQAFDSLMSAAGADETALPVVFDGALKPGMGSLCPVQNLSVAALPGSTSLRLRQSHIAVPEPSAAEEVRPEAGKNRITLDTAIDEKTEGPIINRGLAALKSVSLGKPLFDFFDSEKVEIRWKPLARTDKDPAYAYACPPEECGDKKIIYLNKRDHIDLFYSSDPTFLAVTLAHELTHLRDYRDIGGGVKKGAPNSAALFLELNAWSAETYIYHQLLVSGGAPEPNSLKESSAVQQLRRNLAIRDYMNGGKKPSSTDYLAIIKDGYDTDAYLKNVASDKKSGIMSLAGVVEYTYDIPAAFESMEDPGFWAGKDKKTQYKQYKKLKESLGLSTAEYMKWRKANVDPAPPSSSSGVVAPAVSSGSSSGGSTNPGHTSNDSDGADHTGNNNSGSGNGGGNSPHVPNPGFNPDGSVHL